MENLVYVSASVNSGIPNLKENRDANNVLCLKYKVSFLKMFSAPYVLAIIALIAWLIIKATAVVYAPIALIIFAAIFLYALLFPVVYVRVLKRKVRRIIGRIPSMESFSLLNPNVVILTKHNKKLSIDEFVVFNDDVLVFISEECAKEYIKKQVNQTPFQNIKYSKVNLLSFLLSLRQHVSKNSEVAYIHFIGFENLKSTTTNKSIDYDTF